MVGSKFYLRADCAWFRVRCWKGPVWSVEGLKGFGLHRPKGDVTVTFLHVYNFKPLNLSFFDIGAYIYNIYNI